MPKNILFNLISISRQNNGSTNRPYQNAQLKTHLQGGQYYFFPLGLPSQKVNIDHFELYEHHLSVNESPVTTLDCMSDLHYTAFFKGKGNCRYRLHVYFNNNAEIIAKPYFSECNFDGSFKPVACSVYSEVFACLAKQHTQTLLIKLVEAKNNELASYKKAYNEVDLTLSTLCMDPLKNKDMIIDLISRQIGMIESIESLTQFSTRSSELSELVGRKHLLRILGRSILTAKPEVSPPASESSSSSAPPTLPATKPLAKNKAPAQKTALQEKQENLPEELEHLENNYAQLLKLPSSNCSDSRRLLADLHPKLWELEFKLRHFAEPEFAMIRRFEKLKKEVEKNAKLQLLNLLLTGKFNEAKELASFYTLIPENTALLALQRDNKALFEFLLKNNIVDARISQFEIKEVNYHSLLDFCFSNQKLDLLKVLLNHKVSLLEINPKTNLPFATELVNNPNHPLYPALQQANTHAEQLMYSRLERILHLCLPTTSNRTLCEKALQFCQTQKIKLQFNTIEQLEAMSKLEKEIFGDTGEYELVKQVFQDPHVQFLVECTMERKEFFYSLVPPKNKGSIEKVKGNKDLMQEEIQTVTESTGTEMDFDSAKFMILQYLRMGYRIMELNIEMAMLQTAQGTASTITFYGSKPPSHLAKMINRRNEICAEMKRLGHKVEHPIEFLTAYMEEQSETHYAKSN